jgi:hypothetical protein
MKNSLDCVVGQFARQSKTELPIASTAARRHLESDALRALTNLGDLKRQHRSSVTLQDSCDDFRFSLEQTPL